MPFILLGNSVRVNLRTSEVIIAISEGSPTVDYVIGGSITGTAAPKFGSRAKAFGPPSGNLDVVVTAVDADVDFDIYALGSVNGTEQVLAEIGPNGLPTGMLKAGGVDVTPTIPNGLPTGGTTGQVLSKTSEDNYEVQWSTISLNGVPVGGTTGQLLKKNSNTNYDVGWIDPAAADALVTSIGALPTTTGLIEQTGSEVAGIRLIGVTNSTDIPTRGQCDTRYGGFSTAAPTGGVDNDYKFRVDKPFRATLYQRLSGTWTALDNNYTWAGRPTANSTHAGCVIHVTDWETPFQCISYDGGSTYYWVPVAKRLTLVLDGTVNSPTTGNGAEQTLHADTIPAGLCPPHTKIWFRGMIEYTGTTATKTVRINEDASGDAICLHTSGSNTHLSAAFQHYIQINTAVANQEILTAAASSAGFTTGTSAGVVSRTYNFANAITFNWVQQVTSPDTGRFVSREIELTFK